MPRNKTNKRKTKQRKTKQRKTKQRKTKQRKTKKTKYKYRGGVRELKFGFYPAFDMNARIFNPEDVKGLDYTELAGGASEMAKLIQEASGGSEALKILYVRTKLIMKAVNSGMIDSCPKYPPELYDILNNYYTKHNLNVQLLNNNWYRVVMKPDHGKPMRACSGLQCVSFYGYLVNNLYSDDELIDIEPYTDAPTIKKSPISDQFGQSRFHKRTLEISDKYMILDKHYHEYLDQKRKKGGSPIKKTKKKKGGWRADDDDPIPPPIPPPIPTIDEKGCYNFLQNNGFSDVDGIYLAVMIKPYQHDFLREHYIENNEGESSKNSKSYFKADEHNIEELLGDEDEEVDQELFQELGINSEQELTELFDNAYILSAIQVKNHQIVQIHNLLVTYNILEQDTNPFYYNRVIPTMIMKPLVTAGSPGSSGLTRVLTR